MKFNRLLFLAISLTVLLLGSPSYPDPSPSPGPQQTAELPNFVKPHQPPASSPSPAPSYTKTGSSPKPTPTLTAWLDTTDNRTGHIQYYITDEDGQKGGTHGPKDDTCTYSELFTTNFDFNQPITVSTFHKEVKIRGYDITNKRWAEFVSHCTENSNNNYDVIWSP
jgi:hypothetical protein